MGYAFYVLPDGREAGYGVTATCDLPGCGEQIDRGLAYLCGEEPGGSGIACGDYFCYGHLFMGGPCQLCGRCYDRWEARVVRYWRHVRRLRMWRLKAGRGRWAWMT